MFSSFILVSLHVVCFLRKWFITLINRQLSSLNFCVFCFFGSALLIGNTTSTGACGRSVSGEKNRSELKSISVTPAHAPFPFRGRSTLRSRSIVSATTAHRSAPPDFRLNFSAPFSAPLTCSDDDVVKCQLESCVGKGIK